MHFFAQWSVSSATTYISSNISQIVVVLLFIRYMVSLLNDKTKKRLPKGPWGLPLVGYLPFLGKFPHFTLWKLSEKYGNIYTLPVGMQNIVILNDWNSIKDSLKKDSFLGRAAQGSFTIVTGIKSLVDENSLSWREERRVYENLFKTSFDSSIIYKNMLIEMRCLLIYLRKTNQNPLQLRVNFSKYISKIFYALVFGKQFIEVNSLFDSSLFVNISILSLYPPWLGKFAFKVFDIFNHYRVSFFVKVFRSECKTHYKTLRNESSVRDLIDGYLVELKGKKAHSVPTTMSIEKLRANCQVFLSFGTEAFLSCLEWSLISIAYYPGHQKMISEEVERVMGGQRIPEFKDALRMPFTVAFLNEVLRWKTVLPFNFIRRAIEDASILGCFIPKDTLVLCNIWAVHHDPTIWPDPFRFDPTRFLSDDQKSLIEYPEGFMPFSLGKRSCVAEPFVRKLLFLYIVSIVQKFSLSTLNGEEIFDEEYNTTVRPKSQVNLVFKLKHPPPPPPDECLSGSTHPT